MSKHRPNAYRYKVHHHSQKHAIGSRRDYRMLAQLAASSSVSFETLCERFERGLRGADLLKPARPTSNP